VKPEGFNNSDIAPQQACLVRFPAPSYLIHRQGGRRCSSRSSTLSSALSSGWWSPPRASNDPTEVELLVLRHELGILRRQISRPRLRRRDRVFLAAASRLLEGSSWRFFLVTPQTLLRWHRELVRRIPAYSVRPPWREGQRDGVRCWDATRLEQHGRRSGRGTPGRAHPPFSGLRPHAGGERRGVPSPIRCGCSALISSR
jgi:hypothetical protein